VPSAAAFPQDNYIEIKETVTVIIWEMATEIGALDTVVAMA